MNRRGFFARCARAVLAAAATIYSPTFIASERAYETLTEFFMRKEDELLSRCPSLQKRIARELFADAGDWEDFREEVERGRKTFDGTFFEDLLQEMESP